jgi:hypothetical protein
MMPRNTHPFVHVVLAHFIIVSEYIFYGWSSSPMCFSVTVGFL